MADFKDLLLIFAAGLVIGYFLRGTQSSVQAYTNEECWEIVKDERGRVMSVNVKRRAYNG